MARVGGPLLSLSASGTIGKALVYAQWKGLPYARSHVTPANPNSTAQQETRGAFKYISDQYKLSPAIFREPWEAAVSGRALTAQNLVIQQNLPILQTASDNSGFIFSPGARGGLPPASIVITPGNDQLTVDVTPPSAPPGWTLTAAQVAAIPDQDPHDPIIGRIAAGEDLTSTYSVVLTGLLSAQLYHVGAWLKWLTDTGFIAYSIAVTGDGTTT